MRARENNAPKVWQPGRGATLSPAGNLSGALRHVQLQFIDRGPSSSGSYSSKRLLSPSHNKRASWIDRHNCSTPASFDATPGPVSRYRGITAVVGRSLPRFGAKTESGNLIVTTASGSLTLLTPLRAILPFSSRTNAVSSIAIAFVPRFDAHYSRTIANTVRMIPQTKHCFATVFNQC